MAMVLVGATIVASIETTWAGTVTPPVGKNVQHWQYPTQGDNAVFIKKGDEMGTFNMGSSVVLCFSKGCYSAISALATEQSLKMGEAIGFSSEAAAQADAKSTAAAAEDSEPTIEPAVVDEMTESVDIEAESSAPLDYVATTDNNESDSSDSNKA